LISPLHERKIDALDLPCLAAVTEGLDADLSKL
jgi:hypothetical protein